MSGGAPLFWQQPLRYWRWAARERPALFWSCIIGGAGPVMMAVVPPIRHRLGDYDAKPIPKTYPSMDDPSSSLHTPPPHPRDPCALEATKFWRERLPLGPRKTLTGYDDGTEQ